MRPTDKRLSGDDALRSSARIFLCLIFVATTASTQSAPISSAQSGPTSGQTPSGERLSVEQAVRAALAQNLALRAELERIPVAEGQLRQAGLIPNPFLTSTGATDRFYANEGENGWSVGVQQELETAGKRHYRSLTARGDLDRVRHETESTQRDLIARTQKAYFTLVFAERDLNLARETSAILRRFVDLNAERVKVGEAPGVELNLAKIELARSQRNEQEFERRYRGATASLNLLMGRPPAVSVIPTSDFAAPLSLPPDDELLDYGLQHRPEVLAADSNVEARTNAVRLARALRFPNLTLGAGYQQQNSIIGGSSAAGQASQILRRDEQLAFQATLASSAVQSKPGKRCERRLRKAGCRGDRPIRAERRGKRNLDRACQLSFASSDAHLVRRIRTATASAQRRRHSGVISSWEREHFRGYSGSADVFRHAS